MRRTMRPRLVLLWLSAACRSQSDATAPPAIPLPERIVIGATLPFGSAEAQTAQFYHEGYQLAVEQANRAGGVRLGKKRVPLVLEVLDDGGDASGAERQIRSLVRGRKASFLLGSSSAAVVEAQSAVAEQEHILYLTAAGSGKALFERGLRWFFGVQAPVQLLAYTQMRWIDEQQKARRLPTPLSIAMLVEDDGPGREFRKEVRDFAGKTPGRQGSYRIAFEESFAVGQQDFTGPLARVRDARTDVFLADASLNEYLALHRRYRWMGLCHKVLSFGAHGGEPAALEEFGFDGLAYVLSAVWWTDRLARHAPLSRQFVEAFKDDHHRDPDWYGALAYEAARALIAAIAASGSAQPEAVRAQLEAMKIDSILPGGRLVFGADHQAVYPFVVQQNLPDGKAPIVYPNDVAEHAGVAPNPKCR